MPPSQIRPYPDLIASPLLASDPSSLPDRSHTNNARRSAKACIQCRKRKQRCDGASVPCQRCSKLGKQCSFTLEGHLLRGSQDGGEEKDVRWGSGQAAVLQSMQDDMDALKHQIEMANSRIRALEHLTGVGPDHSILTSASPQRYGTRPSQALDDPITSMSQSDSMSNVNIAGATLHAPIHTLRTLIPAQKTQTSNSPQSRISRSPVQATANVYPTMPFDDPVSRGVLSLSEAQQLFDIFFSACHELAPCSSIRNQSQAKDVRAQSPFLFTAICLIGARYWDMDDPVRSVRNWLHPRYAEIVAIFDEHFHNVLLRPTPSNMSLETLQAVLLSIQWPALEVDHTEATGSPSDQLSAKSRFNDAYAWLMIGIAIRFAKYIGLEDCTEIDFSNPSLGEESMSRMRMWLNLVSVDRHLTLTAGLPASLESPPTNVVRLFGSHPSAQLGDLKLAGLAELVNIVQKASRACRDVSLRKLDPISLTVANADLKEWDERWTLVFERSDSPSFRQHMPFTALRWYRLALNAIPIGTTLGQLPRDVAAPTPPALRDGIEAAFHLLWQYSSDAASERPEREASNGDGYTMNFMTLSSFMFAVDSYWITHAYAAVFLVVLYDRGCIDAELCPFSSIQVSPPPSVPRTSQLYRLVRFAASIFDGICQGAAHHPAVQYRSIVLNALHTLEQYQEQGEDAVEAGIDEMLAALVDPGQDWAFLRNLGYAI